MVLPELHGYPEHMADIFDVVADATRRDLLSLLLDRYVTTESAHGELSVGEIVEKLGLSQPTVSKHLKVLREHGLVVVREEGQHRYYSLESTPLEELEDWLIPFLSADFDPTVIDADDDTPEVATPEWVGSDVGERVGRAVADRSFPFVSALHSLQRGLAEVTGRVTKTKR